jgi:hypothetical protein
MFKNTPTYADNVWHHVALTRQNGNMRLYFDGVEIASSNSVSNGTSGPYTGLTGRGFFNFGKGFNGLLDEFRITNGTARYTSNFTPPALPFPNQ